VKERERDGESRSNHRERAKNARAKPVFEIIVAVSRKKKTQDLQRDNNKGEGGLN